MPDLISSINELRGVIGEEIPGLSESMTRSKMTTAKTCKPR
jgi:hypothetical protein